MISGVSKVVVPVDDQERAKEFWTTRVGFELRRDESYGDERWIEVSPSDGAPLLVSSPRAADEPRRDLPDELPHSPVFFNCADIETTYRALSQRGGPLPTPPREQNFGWWSPFEDSTAPATRSVAGSISVRGAAAAPRASSAWSPCSGPGGARGAHRTACRSPGVPVHSTETFYWLEAATLVSTYETRFASEPTQTGVNHWGYDADAKRFRIIFFSNNGPFTEDGNRYAGEVVDGRSTFEGPARFQ